MRRYIVLFFLAIVSFSVFAKISIRYRRRPFYFRFPPQLKKIKGRVVMSKMEYDHPELGKCTYEMVKDLNRCKFFGWCQSKKIKGYPKIFEIKQDFKALPLSTNKVEMGFNQYAKKMIEKINKEHKKHS